MAAAHPRGPAQLVLTASVARRYYLDGRSKVEIAEEFALSRFKVARLLDDARSSGLVRIEIGHECPADLQEFLLDHFDLREDDMYLVEGPVNLNRLSTVCGLTDRPELLYPPFTQGLSLIHI